VVGVAGAKVGDVVVRVEEDEVVPVVARAVAGGAG
jgi:hypothetical protein